LSETRTISIVDDDALARDGIKELVESLGYKALTFVSAEHFLQSGLIAQTVCLISDIQMPGLSGLDLQEELQARGYRTPVILITAYPSEQQRTRAFGAGAIGFLSKPFAEESLIDCLSAAIRNAGSRSAARIS
jgi:FixJ family two-component response regulator